MKTSVIFLVFTYFHCISIAKLYDAEWWKHTIIYELIPYSFKDSDRNGIGDLKGIVSKLDYFVDLKIETIHLTPIYETSSFDMGYDITDYYKIDSRLGSMEDFDELVKEMKKRNMKLILDLVINHSGYKNKWFEMSIDRIDPYTDFYVWNNSKGFDNTTQKEIPPNKWIGIFDPVPGSGWTWNEKRKQFYFHQFLKEQPDFNLNNENLKKELKKLVKFWLDKGVAGFRLDATPFYFEDKEFRDDDYGLRQLNQPETLEFIHEFRILLDDYNEKHAVFERIFVAEARCHPDTAVEYYGRKNYSITHYPYNYLLEYFSGEYFNQLPEPSFLAMIIDWWLKKLPEGAVSIWMTQGHDGRRMGSRIAEECSDMFTIISMMLPGAVGVYYGQEIAMKNGFIRPEQMKDILGNGLRDPARLLMQWNDSNNAGFSTNITIYLPSNSDYFERNVKFQTEENCSHYNLFKHLSSLRKTDTFKRGKFKNEAPPGYTNLYIITRSYESNVLTTIVNFDILFSRVNLTEILQNPSNEIVVAAASVNSGYETGFAVENELINGFFMRPLSSVVLESKFSNIDTVVD